MTKPQPETIDRLIEKIARHTSTEELIIFVADNFGMLAACEKAAALPESSDAGARTRFEQRCRKFSTTSSVVGKECERLLSIFQPGLAQDEQYELLGLTPLASIAEVKSAFHKLSFRYHPDSSAAADSGDNAEKFIAVCRAYKKIMLAHENLKAEKSPVETLPWQSGSRPQNSKPQPQKRKAFILIAAITMVLLIVIFVAHRGYRKRAMLKSLGHSTTVAAVASRPQPQAKPEPKPELKPEPVAVSPVSAPEVPTAAAVTPEKPEPVKVAAIIPQPEPEAAPKTASPPKPEPVKVAAATPVAPVVKSRKTPPPVKKKTPSAKRTVKKTAVRKTVSPAKTEIKPAAVTKASSPKPAKKPVKVKLAAVAPADQVAKSDKTIPTKPAPKPQPRKISHPKKIASKPVVPVKKVASPARPKVKPVAVKKVAVAKPASPAPSLPPLRERVNTFLTVYTDTYSKLNYDAFAALFTDDARENDTLFKQRSAKYHKLFARLKEVSYTIKANSLRPENNRIYVSGKFHALLRFRDGRELNLHGPTTLLLNEDPSHNFKVKTLTYSLK